MGRSPETLANLSLARSALDRSAEQRSDPDLLARLLTNPQTRVLSLVSDTAQVVERAGRTALVLRPANPSDADRLGLFLGTDADGTAYLAVVEDRAGGEPEDGAGGHGPGPRTWRTLRHVGAELDDLDAGLLTTALALANWHRTHTHCPRCGAPTQPAQAGWLRRCSADGSEHYPRTDPAVIVSVLDEDDRLLLARGTGWGEGRFSVLAGFVEPGESLEAAVAREVLEEVGVPVEDVRFLGDQPWPFPSSIMLGFTARARATALTLQRSEIAEARWLTREELLRGIARGEIAVSSRLSIARRLVEHWLGHEIAGPA